MTDELKLQLKISDVILELVDVAENLTRSDLQGVAHAKAMEIIERVRRAQS